MVILIKYIWVTLELPLIQGMDNIVSIKWYVDVSFDVRNDTEIQTRVMITIVQVAVHADWNKLIEYN